MIEYLGEAVSIADMLLGYMLATFDDYHCINETYHLVHVFILQLLIRLDA